MSGGYFDLPSSWEWVRVSEAGAVQLGRQRAPEYQSGEHMRPYLRVANVYENRIDTSDILKMNFSPAEAERYSLLPGDILLNEGQSRELVGRPAMFRGEVPGACFQNTLVRFRAYEGAAHPEYALNVFRYYLRAGYFQNICKWTTNIAHLGAERFAAMPFPLAPLVEQKRIVDKLEVLLARVDACRQRLERIPAILKRFRQSVLAAATQGELTSEWRQARGRAPGLDEWTSHALSELCDTSRALTYGVIKLGSDTPGGVPCLRTSNVRWLKIDTDGMKRITPALSAEFGRTVLRGGEVLVNVRGTLGGVAVVESSMRGWNVSREVAVVPVDHFLVNPYFLAFSIGSNASQRWLSKVKKGVAYTGINIEDLRTLPVSLPPPDEQVEVVRRAQVLLEFADRLQTRYASVASPVNALTTALLAKALRGGLLPQEPDDEPASKMLERIRDRLASGGAAKKGRPREKASRKERNITMKKIIDVLAETREWMSAQDVFRDCGVSDGSETSMIEGVYAELRELVRSKRVAVEAVKDSRGRKVHDRLKFIHTS